MGFIEAMLYPKFLPKMLLKEGSEVPQKCQKTADKRRKIAKSRRWSRRHDFAPMHDYLYLGAWVAVCSVCQLCSFLARVHGLAPLSHARVFGCFVLLCFPWCSGFRRTSNLPWNRSWSLLFYRNPMISPEMKTERILGTIWIKGR